MKNKVYLDDDTLESIKEEGIYPTIIELTTEDCPECYDAARSAYWSQARGVTTCNPHRDNESLGYHLARLFGIDAETVEFSGLWADDELEFFTIPTTISPQEALAAVKTLSRKNPLMGRKTTGTQKSSPKHSCRPDPNVHGAPGRPYPRSYSVICVGRRDALLPTHFRYSKRDISQALKECRPHP